MSAILVVDDNPTAIELVAEVLEPEGFEVIPCEDPAEAVTLAEGADAIILDVMMPGISGFDLLRRLREEPGLAHLPVLMLSALGEGDDRANGLEHGADDYLGKPFHSRELVLRIRKLLDRRKDPGIILEGSLGPFTVGNILQQVLDSRRTGTLTIEDELPLTVEVLEGKIVSAQRGALRGREALLDAIGSGTGRFVFQEAKAEKVDPGEVIGVHGVMMEAAWLQDELEKYRDDVPAAETPLYFQAGGMRVELPPELQGLEIQDVADWLGANPGSSLKAVQSGVGLAPAKIRLAVAWLRRSGFLSDQGPDR